MAIATCATSSSNSRRRRPQTRHGACRSEARDDGAMRSRVARARSRAAVRASRGPISARPNGATIPRARQPVRHAAARREGDGRRPGRLAGALREVGRLLGFLKEPEPPKSLVDAWRTTRPVFMKVLDMAPKQRSSGPCQDVVWEGTDVDLARLPIQTCWPGDAGPLITWGLTVTRGPNKKRQNLGIYRQQVIARNKVIMRWLAHRGGALDFRDHARANARDAVSGRRRARRRSGDDPRRRHAGPRHVVRIPVRRPAARRPHRDRQLPDARPAGADVARRSSSKASSPGRERSDRIRTALEGPFGDHTGYYNEAERFPGAHDRADHAAARSDLSLDLHRQAARRARDARCRAERGVRAAAAAAVSGDQPTSTFRRKAAATGSPSCR